MWEDLIQKAKNGGLDVVETYVFWNVHEPYPGIVTRFSSFISFFFVYFDCKFWWFWFEILKMLRNNGDQLFLIGYQSHILNLACQ